MLIQTDNVARPWFNVNWTRLVNFVWQCLIRLNTLNHIIFLVYLLTYNTQHTSKNCASATFSSELTVLAIFVFGLISSLAIDCRNLFSLHYVYLTFLLGFIYERLNELGRITSYQFTDQELKVYSGMADKLYAIGECIISVKIGTAIGYLQLVYTCLLVLGHLVYRVIVKRSMARQRWT